MTDTLTPAPEKYLIPNLAKACSLLRLLARSDQGLTAQTIAKELQIPRTTAFRILRTLAHQGLVEKDAALYQPGPALLEIGSNVLSHNRIRERSALILQALTRETGETSHLAIPSANLALILEVCDSPNPVRVASRAGTLVDLHCSATGKCLLAYTYGDRLADVLPSLPLTARTKNTITDPGALIEMADQVRRQGYALDNEEYHEGVRCLAAPVWRGQQVIAAIGVTAAVSNFPTRRINAIAQLVQGAATDLTKSLGG